MMKQLKLIFFLLLFYCKSNSFIFYAPLNVKTSLHQPRSLAHRIIRGTSALSTKGKNVEDKFDGGR
jgi:hypothetical protein